jgi:hypothetical protein
MKQCTFAEYENEIHLLADLTRHIYVEQSETVNLLNTCEMKMCIFTKYAK